MPLGRGLGALIPPKIISKITEETIAETGEKILNIPINEIEPNPNQPRKIFSYQDQEELINSIKEHGIIQPLIVSKISERGYQLIAGERRLRAAKILEMSTVPVIVRSVKEVEKLELSLLENIQRKDLNAIEKAEAYQRLISEFNLTQEELAKKLGKSRPVITNTLRLLTLPEPIQQAIEEEKISEGHARVLLSLETSDKQKIFLKRILGLGLSVRELEKQVSKKEKAKKILEPELAVLEDNLRQFFGTKVQVIRKKKGGKIIIEYYNKEDLDRIRLKISNF